MSEDAELLRRYSKEGAEAAFTELVRRYIDLVYSAALRRVGGDRQLAQDVTQQVFIALAKQAPALVGRSSLAGWLYTTSRFASSQAVRTEQRRRQREQETHLMSEPESSHLEWEALFPVLDDAMDRLSSRDREALLLRYFEGRSYTEVSTRLRLSEDAARKRVDRAIERLRELLAIRGLNSSSVAVAALIEANAVSAAPPGFALSVSGTSVAHSAKAAASLVKTLTLMTQTKLAAGVAALIAVLAIGTAVNQINADLRTKRELIALNDSNTALSSQLETLEQRSKASESDRGELKATFLAASSAQASADSQQAQAKLERISIRDPRAAGQELLAAHPEIAGDVGKYFQARVADTYGTLFKSLGLTADQIQQFIDLRARGTGGVSWASAKQSPAGEIGVGDLSPQEMESQIRTLLGDAGYAQYQAYNQSSQPRQLTAQLGASLYLTPSPLTVDQATKITSVLSASASGSGSPNWEAAMAGAQSILSANQLAALDAVRQQSIYQQALNQAVNQSMSQAVAAGLQENKGSPVQVSPIH